MADGDARIETLEDELKVLKGEVRRTLVDLRALLMREDSPLNENAIARRVGLGGGTGGGNPQPAASKGVPEVAKPETPEAPKPVAHEAPPPSPPPGPPPAAAPVPQAPPTAGPGWPPMQNPTWAAPPSVPMPPLPPPPPTPDPAIAERERSLADQQRRVDEQQREQLRAGQDQERALADQQRKMDEQERKLADLERDRSRADRLSAQSVEDRERNQERDRERDRALTEKQRRLDEQERKLEEQDRRNSPSSPPSMRQEAAVKLEEYVELPEVVSPSSQGSEPTDYVDEEFAEDVNYPSPAPTDAPGDGDVALRQSRRRLRLSQSHTADSDYEPDDQLEYTGDQDEVLPLSGRPSTPPRETRNGDSQTSGQRRAPENGDVALRRSPRRLRLSQSHTADSDYEPDDQLEYTGDQDEVLLLSGRPSPPPLETRNGDSQTSGHRRAPKDDGRSSRIYEDYQDLLREAEGPEVEDGGVGTHSLDVNLLSSLTRWASIARKRVGPQRFKDILDLYAHTGHLPSAVRELLDQISQMVEAEAPETPEDAQASVDLIFHLHGILAGGMPMGRNG